MGYRGQDDALRARVEQLETELAAARGEGLKSRREGHSRFDKKLRRQSWVIAGFSIFATLCTLACGALPIGLFFEQRGEEVAAATLRDSIESVSYGRNQTLGTPLMSSFRYTDRPSEGLPDSPFDEPDPDRDFVFAFEEAPNVLFYCGYSCDAELRRKILGYQHDIEAGRSPAIERVRARYVLDRIQADGSGSYFVPSEMVLAYASQRHLSPEGMRVGMLQQDDIEMVYVFAGFAFFAALLMLGGWTSLLVHRRQGKSPVELPTVADYPERDPLMVAVLGLVTGGIYYHWWNYRTTATLRRITGRPDLTPGVDLALTLLSFGLYRAWADWRNAEALDEALARLGDGTKSKVFTLWVLAPFCRVTPFVVPWVLQKGYNELSANGLAETSVYRQKAEEEGAQEASTPTKMSF